MPGYTADINGDGRDEFLYALSTTLYAVNGRDDSGQIVWQTQLPSEPGDLALADGKTEILFIGADSVLYVLDAA